MRWLLFFVAISASADCTSRLLYTTGDYIVTGTLDDDALYVSLLMAHDIERVDLATGVGTFIATDGGGPWAVQNGLFVTAAMLGLPNAKSIAIRDGSVYWTEPDDTLRRMILGGGTAEAIAQNVSQYRIFEDRVVFLSERTLFYKRLTDLQPTRLLSDVDGIDSVTSDRILVTRYSNGGGLYQVHGEILAVSWSGEASKLYEQDAVTYHNVFDLTAADGGSVYVTVRNNYDTRVLARRDGSAVEIYHALLASVMAADRESVTLLEWGGHGGATGYHYLVRVFCDSAPRKRAVR